MAELIAGSFGSIAVHIFCLCDMM